MKEIKNERFGEERALYGVQDIKLIDCKFDGKEDGESALKEAKHFILENCYMNLRYPLWHDDDVELKQVTMTENCRAALWYTTNVKIQNSKLFGIKALRECKDIEIKNTEIESPEFGWRSENISLEDVKINKSEYLFFEGKNLTLKNVDFKGKYSFQYVENMLIENSILDTKDAFWHARNVTVKNSVIKGEYLAWYCENLTFINCKITGTQPFCYCKGLKLVDCEMYDSDLCFEKSETEAVITTPVVSIKNPLAGNIYVPSVGEIIRDDKDSKGKIIITKDCCCA